MPNFYFEIENNLLSILTGQIRDVSELLKDELALEIQFPDNDPELTLSWMDSLLTDLRFDCQNLLSLLENKSFGQGSITLDIEFAESTLRACSAIRHKLRSAFLSELSDSEIELSELNLALLSPKIQKPYTSFVYLAYIQDSIAQSI